jgi:hypothetical protein
MSINLPFPNSRYHVAIWLVGGVFIVFVVAVAVSYLRSRL